MSADEVNRILLVGAPQSGKDYVVQSMVLHATSLFCLTKHLFLFYFFSELIQTDCINWQPVDATLSGGLSIQFAPWTLSTKYYTAETHIWLLSTDALSTLIEESKEDTAALMNSEWVNALRECQAVIFLFDIFEVGTYPLFHR
jgi:hypothetical protein